MTQRAQVARLANGKGLHLQDGPIDLCIEASGPAAAVEMAYRSAAERFGGLLDELCAELRILRSGAQGASPAQGVVARRMQAAVSPYAEQIFITPMAAVAGAVAEEVLAAMTAAADLDRVYVNNGGDIALHLSAGEVYVVGLIDRPDRPSLVGRCTVTSRCGVRGVATSGARGRSFSLGIADAVTVLADTASRADAAATVIANAVDLPEHPAILRCPARDIQPDNDLGERLVTRVVGALSSREVDRALASGVACAEALLRRGLIVAAALQLQGRIETVGMPDTFGLVSARPARPMGRIACHA